MTTVPRLEHDGTIKGVTTSIENGVDVISWRNSDLRKNVRVYLSQTIWLAIALPICFYLTLAMQRDLSLIRLAPFNIRDFIFPVITLLISWGCTIGVAYLWLRRTWTETISIDDNTLTISQDGFLSPAPKVIEIGDIWRFSFERYKHNSDQEYRFSVNFIHKRRDKVAHWMHDEDARVLFHIIINILHRRELDSLIQISENLDPL